MRRGIGRARLCDLAGCPNRWPCRIHGTRRVGDYEHLGRHAGAFQLAPIVHGAEVVSETVPCKGCGVALCACPPEAAAECCDCGDREGLVPVAHGTAWGCADLDACKERVAQQQDALRELPSGWSEPALRTGWKHLPTECGEYYEHVSSARVWRCGAPDCATWGYYGPLALDIHICHGPTAKATRDEAMLAVESLLAAAKPSQLDLPPGWATDGESYFNDGIALMVCSRAKLGESATGWRVCANGLPWPSGWIDSAYFDEAEYAMKFAEQLWRRDFASEVR